MIWKKSFKGKIECANRVFTSTIEKLKHIQADMKVQIEKNQTKIQNIKDDNEELEGMKKKVTRQIEEIGKFTI